MRWLAEQLETSPTPPQAILASVAAALARRHGVSTELIDARLRLSSDATPLDLDVPADAGLDTLAHVHEWLEATTERHTRGMHYTPLPVAQRLIDVAATDWTGGASVCDPTVGGGTFLLAAAVALERLGSDRKEIVERLHGADIDELAVAVARTTLNLWAGTSVPVDNLVVADSLTTDPWPGQRFDWLVGNPPFLNQLGQRTARTPEQTALLRKRFGTAVSAYTDTAALFLRAAIDWTERAGRIVLVQPLSLLAARDAQAVRDAVVAAGSVDALWIATDAFEAAVNVCAVVVEPGAARKPMARFGGVDMVAFPPGKALVAGDHWAPLAAPMIGMPDVAQSELRAGQPSEDVAFGDAIQATAGFRDEYYAVAACVVESTGAPGELRVASVGSIDPLISYWGVRPSKIGGSTWLAPTVSLADVTAKSERVGRWIERLSVPKLLVATQSSTLEVVVDPVGTMVPLTPVVALTVDSSRLWHTAAALSSPWISALAVSRSIGAARSVKALKLAARDFAALPMPFDHGAWDEGAALAEQASAAATYWAWEVAMLALRSVMNRAYAIDDAGVETWFAQRTAGADRRVKLAFDD